MVETLRITCSQKEIDENNNESNLVDYTITEDFTNSTKPKKTYNVGPIWRSISFGDIDTMTGAVFMRLTSDQDLKVKLNSSTTEMENVRDILWKGKITNLEVLNMGDASATVEVMLFE